MKHPSDRSQPRFLRFVDCQISGYAETRNAGAAAFVDIDAQRMSDGVVAFGRDSGLRPAAARKKTIGTLAPPTLGVLYTE
jgi:hypothetical protein